MSEVVQVAERNAVAGFRPSLTAFHFTNSFPHGPVTTIDLGRLGRVPIGDAGGGLCGGMVYAVRDFFEAGREPPDDGEPPASRTPLFSYLAARLLASFDLPAGVLQYYSWMTRPDQDSSRWLVRRRGLAWLTITEQWPSIRADIDAGTLAPLGLVTVRGADPSLLRHNHQVLAYAYDVDDRNVLTLHVYDPNTPAAQADDVRLTLDLSRPTHASPIAHNVNIARDVRGFFRTNYTFCDPQPAFG